MKTTILGTGTVGRTLASKLTEIGHEVMIGTRNVGEKLSSDQKDTMGNPPFRDWYKTNSSVRLGTFEESARFGEIVINATHGGSSVSVLKMAGSSNLEGKILIDLSNPLDFSRGMPPVLLPNLQNTNSLGEEIQSTFPGIKVVKTLNTMWCGLMVNPEMLGDSHVNFISGNDQIAKDKVKELLKQFGWKDKNLIDLGDISASRGTESILHLWLRLMSIGGSPAFNFNIVK